ncbi:MAG: response regulator [Rhodospirillaceae bacterium]
MAFNPERKKTILVVDDLRLNLAIIKSTLSRDYLVKEASNGKQALDIVGSGEPPDLILLDIMMDGMDGYEVCRALKSNEASRDIPVIFLTVMDEAEDEARGFEIGAVDYIFKPIKPSILLARLRTHLALADAIKQLALQNKELIDTARLREDVESITRHDLKSPLGVVIGMPQLMLMQDDLSEGQRENIALILEAGFRMLGMINRSLDMFKMESGNYDFRPWPVDVVAVIREVLTELGPFITSKKLKFDIKVDNQGANENGLIYVMAERLLCHSMFSNLCKNAVESSSEGDTIYITVTPGTAVNVSIDNTGEVPEEIRDRFFEKFVTSGKRGGTGLGTYSALLIAKTHKGSIELDTSVCGRTRVSVILPPLAGNVVS